MPTERNILAATEELLSRGVTEVVVKKHLAERLRSGKKLRVKLGIDPTGPKVHLGRAIPLWKLRAFQDLGHQAVLIVGDFTAQVGDPSDKLSKRPMLTSEKIKQNMATYQVQLGKILDMPKVEWRYNSEWLTKLSFLEIARLAESFSLQQMLARRNFKERLGKQDDISLRELMYPLMQGYDSVAVQADVEIGGFDQLFNLLAGRKIQEHYGKEQQDILTTQMLEGTDGRKMSTSWGNVVTIVDEPNEMFGKLMAVKDELVPKYLLLCTRLPEAEVKQISKSMKGAGAKAAKVKMASEIVTLYHSAKAAQQAAAEFNSVHRDKAMPTEVPTVKIPAGKKKLAITDLLVHVKLASSKAQARRLVEQGGVKVGGKVISDWRAEVALKSGLVIQVGSRKFAKLA
ncbi:MAG: tyrosine--tRNA ligase [Candidatus Veblenbacteria bacterium]|nr:tyrosine--tRNA ligase [Candidatus Veblenbacteria bacterium]